MSSLTRGAQAAACGFKPLLSCFLRPVWVSGFQIRVYTCHLGREETCSFLGFAATEADGGGAGGEPVTCIFNVTFKRLLVRVAGRLHFEDNNFSISGTFGPDLPSFALLCKQKQNKPRGKKEAWLPAVNMRPRKPGQGSSPSLAEKKSWTSHPNARRLYIELEMEAASFHCECQGGGRAVR